MNKLLKCLSASLIASSVLLSGCNRDASVVSSNLSQDADNFKINRRIVFYNAINGEYVFVIQGLCSIEDNGTRKVMITCKTGDTTYKKHYLSIADNVTYFGEQIDASSVSKYQYTVTMKPSTLIPNIQIR